MNTIEHKLSIAFGQRHVGDLIYFVETDQFKLEYTNQWQAEGFPLSPHLLFNSHANPNSIRRYFENQFPEGRGLEILLEEFRVGKNNIFRILQLLGHETSGAFRFITTDQEQIHHTFFRPISNHELSERLDKRNEQGLVIWDGKPRLSIAGVQDKLPVTILSDGQMGLGEGQLASTHILKFQKSDEKIPHLVLNEFFCMKLSKLIGLNVAEVEYKKIGKHPVLLVKRFDRKLINEKFVQRFHIIDGCQALDLPASYKYERNFGDGKDVADIRDGASLNKLFNFTSKCSTPAIALLHTLNWTILNLCLSNSDSHGKNISYFVDQDGIKPAPYYDILSIAIYPKIEQTLAMSIGDEFSRDNIRAWQFKELCDECHIKERLFINQFKKIGSAIIDNLDKVNLESIDLSNDEKQFIHELKKTIQTQTNTFLKCVSEMPKLKVVK